MAKITVSLDQTYEYEDSCQVFISADDLIICTFSSTRNSTRNFGAKPISGLTSKEPPNDF